MDSRPPLWKQLIGAVLGAGVAFLLYEAYTVTGPVITAWVTAPQSQIGAEHPGQVRANQQVGEYTFNRMAARAAEIYKRFAAEPGPQAERTRKSIEVTQPLPERSASSIAFIAITGLPSSPSANISSASVLPASSSEAGEARVMAATGTEGFASSASVSSRVGLDRITANDSGRAIVTQTEPRRSRAIVAEQLAGKKLPSSGLGTTFVAVGALATTALLRKRRKK